MFIFLPFNSLWPLSKPGRLWRPMWYIKYPGKKKHMTSSEAVFQGQTDPLTVEDIATVVPVLRSQIGSKLLTLEKAIATVVSTILAWSALETD